MRVSYEWTDAGGETYSVEAEVNPVDRNRITIISVTTDRGVEVDFNDYDDGEKKDIRWLAKEAAAELDKFDNEQEDEDDRDEYRDEEHDYQ